MITMRGRLLTALDRGVVDRARCVSPDQTTIADLSTPWAREAMHIECRAHDHVGFGFCHLGRPGRHPVPFETTMDSSAFGAGVEMVNDTLVNVGGQSLDEIGCVLFGM